MLFNVNVIWKFPRKRSKEINHLPTRENETNVMLSWADLSVKFKTRFRDSLPNVQSCCSRSFKLVHKWFTRRGDDSTENIYDICRMVRKQPSVAGATTNSAFSTKKKIFWKLDRQKLFLLRSLKHLEASPRKNRRNRTWLNIQISPEKISGKQDKKCIRPLRTINDAF